MKRRTLFSPSGKDSCGRVHPASDFLAILPTFLALVPPLQCEKPLMPCGIFCGISTLAERCIREFLNDSCSSFLCAFEVLVNASNVDEEALCCLPKFSRILVVRTGAAHHHKVLAELHCAVPDLAVRIFVCGTVFPKTKSFIQKSLSRGNIGIIKIGDNRHSPPSVR